MVRLPAGLDRADLVNVGNIAAFGAPLISVGGAGTFDDVFLAEITAGLFV